MKRIVACLLAFVCCMPLFACAGKNSKQDLSETPQVLSEEKNAQILAVAEDAISADVDATWKTRFDDANYSITELKNDDGKYEGKYYQVFATVSYVCDLEFPIPDQDQYPTVYAKRYAYLKALSELYGHELVENERHKKWYLKDVSCTAIYTVTVVYESNQANLQSMTIQTVVPNL
ncbi:MAG: hypothetical protein IJW29_05040 [Clostridia bacterium]|nr:hypothetical protein [Clostridia bacterium]